MAYFKSDRHIVRPVGIRSALEIPMLRNILHAIVLDGLKFGGAIAAVTLFYLGMREVSALTLGLAAAVTVMVLLLHFMTRRGSVWQDTRSAQLEWDAQVIRRILPDGGSEEIAWRELTHIAIVTTDQGPQAEDVWWLLKTSAVGHDLVIGNGDRGFPELLEKLQTLPGFHNEGVIRAMRSPRNGRFEIWQKSVV